MFYTIKEICEYSKGTLLKGHEDIKIGSLSDTSKSSTDSIVYINDKNFLENLDSISSKTCLTSSNYADILVEHFDNVIISESPYYSFALLTNLFSDADNISLAGKGAFVDKSAKISNNVLIGSNAFIGKNVTIGKNTIIEPNVVVHDSTKIGENCLISAGTIVGSQGFGFANYENKWHHISHIGNVEIGNNVSIGANCCIDRGTLGSTFIAENVIIDNLVHIAHNVEIGANTAIAAKSGIAGSTKIGQRCMIGGMVGIFGHLKIVDDVIITPKSNVYKNINKPGKYSSLFPLLDHTKWKKLSLLIQKLDKMYKFIKQV